MRRFSCLCLIFMPVFANAQLMQRVYGPFEVQTSDGTVTIEDFRLWDKSLIRDALIGPRPTGLFRNGTGTSWQKLFLTVRFQCPGESEKTTELYFYRVRIDQTQRFGGDSSDADPACNADVLSIVFDRGISDRQLERERKAKEDEANLDAAAEVARQIRDAAASIVSLHVPKGFLAWGAFEDCASARALQPAIGKDHYLVEKAVASAALEFGEGRKVAVLSRAAGCARVRFFEQSADLFVASALAPLSNVEKAAAARKVKADAENARLERIRIEDQAKRDADAAAEKARIEGKCSALFKSTANKKVGDLTVMESQQVQACTALGMYHQ